jgi:hydroxymethylglutaryl-CoA lyase
MDNLPSRVRIWEVGPRDGLQNESSIIETATKIEFINRLTDAGLPVVEATSFVRADRIPQLADGADVMAGISRRVESRYPVLVPNVKGLDAAMAADALDIAVFASATETFAQRNLGRSLSNQMEMFAPVLDRARVDQIPVRGYVSMCFGDPWEGFVDPSRVVDVCVELVERGCSDVSLGDTIGVATPGQVRQLIDLLVTAGLDVDRIGVHFHDTYGQALSNTLAALQSGVSTVDASAGGLGG